MTVAVDIKTGAVIGQVCDFRKRPAGLSQDPTRIAVLTRYGYMTFSASSVRLEECA